MKNVKLNAYMTFRPSCQQLIISGNWLDYYDEANDTLFETCPVVVTEAELMEIDPDRMVWQCTPETIITVLDGIGNEEEYFELAQYLDLV